MHRSTQNAQHISLVGHENCKQEQYAGSHPINNDALPPESDGFSFQLIQHPSNGSTTKERVHAYPWLVI